VGRLSYKYSPKLTAWLADHVGEYDVLHIHSVFNHSTHAAARAARRRGVPYIIRTLGQLNRSYALQQGTWKKKAYLGLLGRRDLDSAAALHCTSQGEKADVEALGLRPPVVVIPVGQASLPVPVPARKRKGILFLGRIHPKKGFDLLFPALAGLNTQLTVAGTGDPDYLAGLKLEAARLELAVAWPGMVSGAAKEELLARAAVFVLPSYSENFGIAVAEAMACGIPVVISDQVDLWPEVQEYGAGLVVPCRVAELAEALARVLANPAGFGENGRRLVRERLDWKVVVSQLRELYQKVAR
jgi:glycosyltransferase involved in cell wall biosynthesis